MSLFAAKIDLKKAFQGAERARGVEARAMTVAVDSFRPKLATSGDMTPARWVDPEYTTIGWEGMTLDVRVPYEAVEILYEKSKDTREAIDLCEKNWADLSRQYHEKTGLFAPKP